jgi:hypothetical protein
MKTLTKIVMLFVLVAVFNGCSGGSSSGNDSSGSTTPPETKSAVIMDNLVIGLTTIVNGETSKTDSNGQLSYKDGETISFYIGKMKLGEISEVPSDGRIFIQDLVGVQRTNTSDARVVKIAQFLQSLDSNPLTDEIEISSTDNDKFNDITTDVANTSLSVLTSKGFTIVSEADAIRHLQNSLKQFGIIFDNDTPSFTSNVEDGDSDIEVNTSIVITFSEDMPKKYILSGDYITFEDTSNAIAFSVSLDNNVATITPNSNLANATEYTLTLKSSIADYAGNELLNGGNVDKVITFTTQASNQAPTWTQASYDTGLTIEDTTDASQTIMDLTTASSDADGDTISYSIENISAPDDQTIWNNSLYVDNGVLKVQNLLTNDPNFEGTVTVTVKASDNSLSNDTNVSFTFSNVN